VIVVVPTGKTLSAGTPLRAILTLPALSVAVAVPSCVSVTTTLQVVAPAPVFTVTFAGALIVGAVTSLTVNVTVVVAELPALSVAVSVIVCVPTPTTVPASGLWVTVTGPQLSLAVVPATTLGIVA
jgi:hypothetical protein